jgi:glycosyltransferase involved in cell wall biosynthesis
MARGIFITYRGFIEGPSGGVQVCTREYIDVIKAAGIELAICAFNGDRRLSTRLLRRLNSSPYFRPFEPKVVDTVRQLAAKEQPKFVFLNQADIAPIAPIIRKFLASDCKIVMLSHGLASTDLLHFIRTRRWLPLSGRTRPTAVIALGSALMIENTLRADIDVVCALSPFDVELEHWLGAKFIGWLPRVVTSAPLDWRPSGNRLGYIGTLDHAPNLEGLVLVLEQLASRDAGRVRVRVVGRPDKTGQWLARRYPNVEYLGPLDDAALRNEAASWNAVMHPIFCHARGCSTKLATAVGWHIPVVTTTMGHRGYEWRDGGLVVTDSPELFAEECLRLLDFDEATTARQRVAEMAHSSPTIEENAMRLCTHLNHQR